ncbi:hypothetical protein I350_06690 [Cryptococcus amylolentus CBS 6273]|uniref:Uncharacterized protein n=1 Tax=Cryptococcus amylolentus CBS 6273 TaxID=1296118 RepID=A0A1E3JHD7_9TREE|nr:hypothetical protein I350_06690 [Cryptococcus amylolentus CBS 6273]
MTRRGGGAILGGGGYEDPATTIDSARQFTSLLSFIPSSIQAPSFPKPKPHHNPEHLKNPYRLLPSTHTPLLPTTPPRADSRSPSKGGPTNISRSKTGRERRKKNSGLSRFTSSPASSSPGDSGSSSFTSASPTPKPKYRRRVHPLQHIPRLQREPSLETITESDESDVSDGSSTPGLSRSSSVSRLSPSPSLSSLTSLGRLVGLSNGGKGSDEEGEGGEEDGGTGPYTDDHFTEMTSAPRAPSTQVTPTGLVSFCWY